MPAETRDCLDERRFTMKKQWLLLLVLAIVLTSAPAAMAAHCERCRPVAQSCGSALNYGWEYC
jgi:hypothetical protein